MIIRENQLEKFNQIKFDGFETLSAVCKPVLPEVGFPKDHYRKPDKQKRRYDLSEHCRYNKRPAQIGTHLKCLPECQQVRRDK